MKNYLITGGTSGLGLELARVIVQKKQGRAALVARGKFHLPDDLKRPEVCFIQADISNKYDIHRITALAFSHLGAIDVLVNNASALGPTPLKLLLDTECEDFESVLATNLLGPFRLTKAVLPSMVIRGRGLVMNISSDAAVSAYPRWGAYGVSKAALDHLSRIWNEEVKTHGVRFLAVDPTDMDTPMHAAAIPDADRSRLRAPSEAASRLLKVIEAELERAGEEVRRAL